MNVLILGALPGNEEETTFYQEIIDMVTPLGADVKSPIDTAQFNGTDAERYTRAMKTVQEADVVIAETSKPSTGQGIEIRECDSLNKPIIVIARQGSKVSGLVRGCPATKEILFYDDVQDVKEEIISLVQSR